ncbi:E3 ubiquitin-protein ligase MPSR1 [Ricinus communis]|uniref:RING-type E3 ubiquitin transferase n=1 Tax=Ricinus communis TaxID=3988 RepID=B9T0T5_RICCO|nr:E3 ubiquitin-protein ligase MPSR1 [Ricinus communis]EEF30532.1 zinc finger protein, putative [Ricinus communis]|eukprot:XP_002531854.1 E3 ubiquitin-protein ligase MPSR1 [Ricinus communis]
MANNNNRSSFGGGAAGSRSRRGLTDSTLIRVRNLSMQLRQRDQYLFHIADNQTVSAGQLPAANKSGPSPASKESVDAMPRIIVTEDCRVKECAICLDDVGIGSEVREMPCNHRFHSACIENWLAVHGSCPVCRYVMPVQEDDNPAGNAEDGGEYGLRQRRR